MNIKNGGPAFPHNTVYPDNAFEEHSGLSMRDYFAAKAMQAFLTDPTLIWTYQTCVSCAKSAYTMADAMLAERGKMND
jgi:uncharacterized protein YfaT (DUF1175 family)